MENTTKYYFVLIYGITALKYLNPDIVDSTEDNNIGNIKSHIFQDGLIKS